MPEQTGGTVEAPREPSWSWQVGDRVVVAWHQKEHAATVVKANKRFYIVETDEPYNREGHRTMHRSWLEIFNGFNDGHPIPVTPPSGRGNGGSDG